MSTITAYIGIGSNLGDRRDFCSRALGLLAMLPRTVLSGYSSAYETEAVGDVGGPFLNLVARIETELPPERLLEILRETERGLGRDLDRREGPRTIDLDLLFYGDQILQTAGPPSLTVPHPRLHRRRFVLAPLAELAPELRHPTLDHSISELLQALNDPHDVRRLTAPVIPWTRAEGRCEVPRA
jgi:2-amino-4-hydroxy-6-hydroxymethyldihydropteridine diphosphokinase